MAATGCRINTLETVIISTGWEPRDSPSCSATKSSLISFRAGSTPSSPSSCRSMKPTPTSRASNLLSRKGDPTRRRPLLPSPSMAEHGQQHLQENQENDDQLHKLHAEADGLIGNHSVDALDHFELAMNAALPFAQMEARGQQAIQPR